MKERPILFSAPMVRALLDGSKTQTRRVVKRLPIILNRATNALEVDAKNIENGRFAELCSCPYGQPGDRLWVRETWQAVRGDDRARHICTVPRPNVGWLEYAATPREDEPAYKWRPSIHMPRWASRITLEVTEVRVERLQDISEADAIAEGWTRCPEVSNDPQVHKDAARDWYSDLWESINSPGGWDANPWVWVISFKRLEPA